MPRPPLISRRIGEPIRRSAGSSPIRCWRRGRLDRAGSARRAVLLASLALAIAGAPSAWADPPPGTEALVEGEASAAEDDGAGYDEAWEDDWDDWEDELDAVESGYPDPLEPVNRVTLALNNGVDRYVLDPVTRLYRFALPEFFRGTVIRIFNNVNSPQIIVNDGLQLEWPDAGVITARLLINSTLGVGGVLDPAVSFGLEHHDSDFGQTLTLAGVPSGFYIVLPLLGPANVRDGIGLGVDSLLHPTFYVLGGTDLLIFGGSAGLTERARHYEELKALKESSVDVYSALRSGYYQNRQAEIWGRRESRRPAAPVADDVADEAGEGVGDDERGERDGRAEAGEGRPAEPPAVASGTPSAAGADPSR